MLERSVCNWSLPDDGRDAAADELPETLHYRIWIIRKLSIFLCFCVSGFIAYNFVDYNRVNNKLLEDIRKQNADLKMKMEMMQVDNRNKHYRSTNDVRPPPSAFDHLDGHELKANETDAGNLPDSDNSSDDDDSTLSFNSTQTDHTWREADFNNEEELSVISEDDEDGPDIEPDDLKYLIASQNSSLFEGNASSVESPRGKKRSGRSSRTSTPMRDNLDGHCYNLRRRDMIRPPKRIDENESDHAFFLVVKEQARKTRVCYQ